MSFNYVMSPSGRMLHESDKAIKLIYGPFGSGKSAACAVDLLSYAVSQAPAPDGVRYTRIGVVRSTYPELQTTSTKTIREVFPADCGYVNDGGQPIKGMYTIPLDDGTTAQIEFVLIALRTPDDCQKVRSLSLSFCWINEATGVDPMVYTTLLSRIGRYPSQDLGGCSWAGIIMDFNMPATGSWLHNFITNPADNMLVVKQPPAVFKIEHDNAPATYEANPDAENLRNLGAWTEGDPDLSTLNEQELDDFLHAKGRRYYMQQVDALLSQGRSDVVDNLYAMLPCDIVDGKLVYPSFNRMRHVAKEEIKPVPFERVIIGCDTSGIHPAACIVQMQNMKWCVLDEIYAEGEGLESFIQGMLLPLLRNKYNTNPAIAALDPANARDSWTAITPRQRFEEVGIQSVTEITNSPKIRIQTVEHLLNLEVGGLLVSPTCDMIVRGFSSDYKYRRLRATGTMGAAYSPQPEKNEASHIMDALSYFAVFLLHDFDRNEKSRDAQVLALQERRNTLRRLV